MRDISTESDVYLPLDRYTSFNITNSVIKGDVDIASSRLYQFTQLNIATISHPLDNIYITKLALLVAALGALTISAAPSPEKTFDDFDDISSLSTDLRTAIDRMPVLGYDASSVHDLFAATVTLYQGVSEINKANANAEPEDFSEDEQKEICRDLHRTRYTQGSLIMRLGDQAERISQFPLTPSIGKAIGVYEEELAKFQDELNSRVDNCSDDYQQRLEDAIKTAKAQYAATAPKA